MGRGVLVDYYKAVDLYEDILSKHSNYTQLKIVFKNLGDCYANGWGVDADIAKAKQLWKQANEKLDLPF